MWGSEEDGKVEFERGCEDGCGRVRGDLKISLNCYVDTWHTSGSVVTENTECNTKMDLTCGQRVGGCMGRK
ncbi:hypothetical protein SERLADRAFT_472459 [Serpula lacrymans var. lacrymans S7.9]|uniref:Uncharacterized protein n=1 Tax=Serpula lacrymans var. lacrymans (strain S7.9) TaxID=578457 RepID=F8P3L3_SERL9|nr:uncharacterized protein SERLADRAFT_472459 [Serpula lacrymans var. lacrymans S7.9]EGO22112.1 hypothetical protein SERLADRAFT_472459 [Serpula lacrymans var. lacrymans S7.9]